MPARSVRRRQHKQAARLDGLDAGQRLQEARGRLAAWAREAARRAQHLGAPAVWALAASAPVQAVIARLDPDGSLQLEADLRRVCAEAIARAVDWRLGAARGRWPIRAGRRCAGRAQAGGAEARGGARRRPQERRAERARCSRPGRHTAVGSILSLRPARLLSWFVRRRGVDWR